MNILLHICCAPCSVMTIEKMREEGHQLTGYWYNPNIHPYTEYLARLNALKEYSEVVQLPMIIRDEYGLQMFTKNVIQDLLNRCDFCYIERLRETARVAKQQGFDAFSTTLLISPYQKHDRLIEIGKTVAKEEGIPFYDYDLRPFFREGMQKARSLPLYMQKYCGCIFSEEERYLSKKKR